MKSAKTSVLNKQIYSFKIRKVSDSVTFLIELIEIQSR